MARYVPGRRHALAHGSRVGKARGQRLGCGRQRWPSQFLRGSAGRALGIWAGDRARRLAGSAHQPVILAMETIASVGSTGERGVRRSVRSQSGQPPVDFGTIQSSEPSERIARIHPIRWQPIFSAGDFRATRLSARLFPGATVLKIDVETHETRVLRGARRLLETVRPVIWCEVSPENSKAVFDILNRASWDTLAVPKPQARGESPVLVSKPA